MKIIENYNSTKQKYGIDLVNSLSKKGLPPQFLLSACRFVSENGVSHQHIVNLFKEWMKYVAKHNNADVNTLSYEQFFDLISHEKTTHCIPNVIFCNDVASLGKLNNAKDVQSIPVKNQWCIKSQKWYDKYKSKGYDFYVIYLPKEPLPFTFVIAAVVDGNVEYYDSNDYEQYENLGDPKQTDNSDHEKYQRKLPQEIVSYLYNIAVDQAEQIENNNKEKTNENMKNAQKISLNEAQLRGIIIESVKNILKEAKV